MIQLKINGQAVDLEPNVSIRLELQSCLFDFDVVQGIWSYPFSIPLTSTNKKVFGFVHMLESRDSLQKTYDCELYLNDKLYLKGLFNILRASNKAISGSIASGPGEFANAIKGMKLADVLSGTITLFIPNPSAADTTHGTVDDYSHVFFPLENPDAYGVGSASINPDWGGTINGWSFVAGGGSGDFENNPTTAPRNNEFAMCPYLYLIYILERIFESQGYTMSGDFVKDPEIRTLVVYNNYLMDLLIPDTFFGGPAEFNRYGETPRAKHVPDMLISDFLVQLRKMFCIAYVFDTRRKTVQILSLRKILSNTKYREASGMIIPKDYEFEVDPTGYKLSFDIDSTENTDGGYQFQDFEDAPAIYDEQFGTLPASPFDGQMIWDKLLNRFFIFDGNNGVWSYYSENVIPITVGDGGNNMQSPVSPLMQNVITSAHPYIRNVCTSVPFQNAANDFESKPCGFRLTFYRGRINYGSGEIPVACSSDYDNGGNTWNYSLFWNGEKGLYNVWWKTWVEFMMSAKRVKFPIRLTEADLFNYSPIEKLKLDNSRYLPFNFSVTLTNKDIFYGEATLYRQ